MEWPRHQWWCAKYCGRPFCFGYCTLFPGLRKGEENRMEDLWQRRRDGVQRTAVNVDGQPHQIATWHNCLTQPCEWARSVQVYAIKQTEKIDSYLHYLTLSDSCFCGCTCCPDIVLLLAFNDLHDLGLGYLRDSLLPYNPSHSLRSSEGALLQRTLLYPKFEG